VDSFAVAAALGQQQTRPALAAALRIALVFSACQAGMAWAGSRVGQPALRWLGALDHWIAAVVLVGFGAHELWKAWRPRESQRLRSDVRWASLFMLGIATSLDALSVGFGSAALGLEPGALSLSCALTTALACLVGVLGAQWLGNRGTRVAGVLGGLILIGLAVKTVLEHRARGV
jgi:manganese efflux pump family protein